MGLGAHHWPVDPSSCTPTGSVSHLYSTSMGTSMSQVRTHCPGAATYNRCPLQSGYCRRDGSTRIMSACVSWGHTGKRARLVASTAACIHTALWPSAARVSPASRRNCEKRTGQHPQAHFADKQTKDHKVRAGPPS